MAGLLEDKWRGLLQYIEANTPRNTRPVVRPGKVFDQGLVNPNQYNAPAANNFKDSALGLLGGVPGAGDYASGVQAADYWNRGEKLNAGLAALGTLPIIPSLVAGGATLGGLGVMNKVAQKIGTPLPAGPARDQAGAIVYHGSPHKFDAFDMSKIGTGEGAQAYGHGLYFAESPDVAKTYADTLGEEVLVKGKQVYKAHNNTMAGDAPISNAARNALQGSDWNLAKAKAAMQDAYKTSGDGYFKRAFDELNTLADSDITRKSGAMYKVDIPDEAIPRMLDWDKKLSEQSESVRRAIGWTKEAEDAFYASKSVDEDALLASLMGDAPYQSAKHPIPQGLPSLDTMGSQLVKGGSIFDRGSDVARAEALKKMGIPGIRYLDGNSRGTGGTSNYVLFDDQLPRILEINGQPTGLLSYADEAKKAKKK